MERPVCCALIACSVEGGEEEKKKKSEVLERRFDAINGRFNSHFVPGGP